MNYYIQGDKERAEEIKAAFEKLGVASNANRYNYKNDYVLYFSAGGMIHMIDANGSWANIIKTHPDYKELELPVEPKFKVGDEIIWINHDCGTQTITDIRDDSYITVDKYGVRCALKFVNQDKWELVPKPHYDINNFKPKQWVLTRDTSEWDWELTMFAYLNSGGGSKFTCINGVTVKQCIPFDGNEHLLGTADMCPEEYINW